MKPASSKQPGWHGAGRPATPKEAAAVVLVCVGLALGVFGLAAGLRSLAGLPRAMAVHGAMMVVAWGIMMPAGAIVARYFKVTPRQDFPRECDNPFWWRWHRTLQYAGVLLCSAGVAVVLGATGGHVGTLHGVLGLTVLAIGWLQVGSAWLRGTRGGPTDTRADPRDAATWRGDHYDMTRRRRLFEAWHKPMGWAVIVLSGITILLGVDLVGAPVWLMLLVATCHGGALLTIIDSHVRRRWVDTYAALWGAAAAVRTVGEAKRCPGDRRSAERRL